MLLPGLIFGAIALGWIAFLVPWFVARREGADPDEIDPLERFGQAMKIVSRSSAFSPLDDVDSEVSTPLTRRASRAEIAMMSKTAARRRRNVVLVLLGLTVAAGIAVAAGVARWYTPVVPGVLLVGFLGLARFSVKKLNASLDAQLAALADDWHEDTVSFEVPASLREGTGPESTELSIEISAPVGQMTASLWDPIPVTAPTYVSKPLVPRTVRTIDLSAPESTVHVSRHPVVAEAPQTEPASDLVADERRAVNE